MRERGERKGGGREMREKGREWEERGGEGKQNKTKQLKMSKDESSIILEEQQLHMSGP